MALDPPVLSGIVGMPVAPESHLGERIGAYRLLETLGEGGMGIVYLAEQEQPFRRRVALKVIKLGMDTREVVSRFESERQTMALMEHPNIASVFDAGATADGRPYFVMEYVPGIPITDYCDGQKLSTRARLQLFAQVCAALQHAHQKGIIHRDLKPSNVLVMEQDSRPVPKVIDFGIAKAITQLLTERTLFTEQGLLIGTPEYMSPERASLGDRDVDTRTDIYSLGVLLYELLVGALPFNIRGLRRAGYDELRRIIREEEPVKPSTRVETLGVEAADIARRRHTDTTTLRRQLRGDLDWITLKALDKDPARRYASASELAADIGRHLNDEPVVARSPGAVYRARKFARKHTALVTGTAAVGIALVGGLIVTTMQYSRAERALRDLEEESYTAHIRAADLHLRSLEVSEARRQLANTPAGLRDWEWRHLFARSDASRGLVSTGGGVPNVIGTNPEGTRVFWTSDVGGVRMADLKTLEPLPELTRPQINSPAEAAREFLIGISPDGSRYASIAWAAAGGRAFTKDGQMLSEPLHPPMPPEEKNTIVIKETQGGAVLTRISAQLGGARVLFSPADRSVKGNGMLAASAGFSRDGKYVATWSHDRVLRIHNITTGALVAEFRGHESEITCAEFSPDGMHIVSGSYDRTVRLWNLSTRSLEKVITGHEEAVWTVAFSPDGRQVASGGSDRVVRLWNLDGTLIHTFQGHRGGIATLAFAPSGDRLASGSGDRSIRVWSTNNSTPAAVLIGHTETVTSLAFSPDGEQIISGSADLTVRVWEPRRAAVSFVGSLGGAISLSLALSPDGSRVATGNADGSIRVWDRQRRSEGRTFKGQGGSIRDLAFSDEGSKLVSIGLKAAYIWDATTGALLSARVWPKPIVRISLLPGERKLVETAPDGSVRLWNVEGEEPPVNLSPGLETRAQGNVAKIGSGNGQRLAVANNRQIGVWDVTRRTRLLLLDFDLLGIPASLGAFALSSDGTRLASGNQDGIIRVWEVPSGQLLYQFKAHAGPVNSIAFNPAGTRLVSSSAYNDRSVRIWRVPLRRVVIPVSVDLETPGVWIGEPVLTLDHDTAVIRAAMSADGATLATWDRGGLNLWHGESAYSVEARHTVDVLRDRELTSLDVISALTADRAINPDVRRDALKYAAALGDSPSVLSQAAMKLAFVPGRQPEAYRRAVTLAESGVRGAPGDARGSLHTVLGAAYYRVGRYADAINSLQIGTRLNPESDSANLAFTAMAQQRLGQPELARRALERFETLTKEQEIPRDGVPLDQRTALGREAASVVRGQ
jgi:WD40 repeat protein/serine/threonine protein kinase